VLSLAKASMCPAALWVKNVGGAGSCDFPTDHCKFQTGDYGWTEF